MKRLILTGVMALTAGSPVLLAQKGQCPVPNTKSLNECRAVIAMIQGQSNPDTAISTAEDLISKFSDTSYKDMALFAEATAYDQKKDVAKAQVYAEQALQTNPKNYQAPNLLGRLIEKQTGEHDLDKDQKIASAEKYFNMTIENVKTATKPFPQMPDDKWEEFKKSLVGDAHDGLGVVALNRKNFDAAVTEFKAATEALPTEPAFQVRLASAYVQDGKNADAIALCDKILADPQVNPQVRQVAQSIKANASAKK
jgi:tetratricopeptide (TPR) repeat protein